MVQNMSNGNKYCPPTTLPKWGSNKIFYFGGGMALFWLASSGVGTPIRPVLITPQWTPVFKWGELPPIWGRYGCLKIWKFLDGCMGHATWQRECTTLTGKVLSAWVLINKVTHMHTYIIPYKPTPITLSVIVIYTMFTPTKLKWYYQLYPRVLYLATPGGMHDWVSFIGLLTYWGTIPARRWVTHPSSNRALRGATLFIRRTTLPEC